VVLRRTWLGQVDYLSTVPGPVIITLSFSAVTVPDVVSIIFLELIPINVFLLRELTLPEGKRFFHREADTFHEEPHLEATVVFKVMLLFQLSV